MSEQQYGGESFTQLKAAYAAAVEAHKTHRPRLYRGADGIYRCPQCDPPSLRERMATWWERAVDAVRGRRRR